MVIDDFGRLAFMQRMEQVDMDRRTLLFGGAAVTGIGLLGGLGDKLFANRSFKDFVQGATPSQYRDRINQGLAECAAAGQPVTGSAGTWAMDGPVHIPSKLNIKCEPGCIIQKAYDDRFAGNALLLTAGNFTRDADDFVWDGGEFRPRDGTLGDGNLATLLGRRWIFRNAIMRDWRAGQCFLFGGGGFLMSDVDARSPVATVGTGAYRCIWNEPDEPSLCTRLYGASGDDVFQAAPLSLKTSTPRFGLNIGGLTYDDCEGVSHVARLMVAIIVKGRPHNEDLLPSRITNCTFRNIRGKGGKRSVVIENSFGDMEKGSYIDNILIQDCDVDCSVDSKGDQDSVRIFSDREGIGKVVIENTKFRGSKVNKVMLVNGVRDLVVRNSVVEGNEMLLRAGDQYDVGNIDLTGTHFAPKSHGRPPLFFNTGGQIQIDGVTVDGASRAEDAIRSLKGGLRKGRASVTGDFRARR